MKGETALKYLLKNANVYLKGEFKKVSVLVENGVIADILSSGNKEKELETLNKEKERLENSIVRREKLLSNENYVAKAPQNLVEQERKTLEQEKENLEAILSKLEK